MGGMGEGWVWGWFKGWVGGWFSRLLLGFGLVQGSVFDLFKIGLEVLRVGKVWLGAGLGLVSVGCRVGFGRLRVGV